MFSKCLQLSPELLEQEYQPALLAAAICHELGPDGQAAAEQPRNRMFEAAKGTKKEQELRDLIQASLVLKDGRMVDKQMAES
jgi:hypothetical protein